MAKEMIISSSAHEKKIAIIEDGIVTEYYVERVDESQGLAGNIYKGRVMKVLPGMQSAFVNIGLERDAFLYVSDFFEEEGIDEFDTLTDIKEPRDGREPKEAREPREERRVTPGQPPTGVERREPPPPVVATPPPVEIEEEEIEEEDFEEEDLPVTQFTPVRPIEVEEEDVAAEEEEEEYEPIATALSEPERTVTPEERQPQVIIPPPSGDFIRIQDDPMTEEEMASRAREREAQAAAETSAAAEAIAVQGEPVADVEAVAEETVEAEPVNNKRGSRKKKEPAKKKAAATKSKRGKKGNNAEEPAEEVAPELQFERIVDDDIADAGELLKDAIVQQRLVDEIRRSEFESSPIEHIEEPEVRVGSLQWQPDTSFQRIVDEEAAAAARNEHAQAESMPATSNEISSVMADRYPEYPDALEIQDESITPERAAASGELYGAQVSEGGSENKTEGEQREGDGLSSDLATDGGESDDMKANVRVRDRRGNFASRRGGRRRGRRGGAPSQPPRPTPVVTEEAPAAEKTETAPVKEPTNGGVSERGGGGRHYPPGISELLREGQEIIIQIAKEPIALKGARITSHIALPGRYLVYMPTVNHIGVSRKIPSDSERLRLKRTMLMLRDREKPPGGFIVRTACEGHTEQELYDDMMYLVRTWQDIRRKAERTKAPSLVYRELDLVQRTLRDLLADDFTAIRVDNEIEYTRVVDFVNRFQPKLVKRVKLYTWKKPIFEEYGVQEEIDKAIKPRVWLRSGGYIVINQTEALVAIDVNTGKFVGKSNRLEDTITKTNLDAVKEIVRQIRLRDLGGIIVLDFIDMEERKNRQKVMQALEAELKADRSPSKILQFNDFGLVAITRKRVRQSLERTLCSPCSYCQGAGLVKSPQTVCYEILAEARRIASESDVQPGADIILRVNPEVAEALRGSEKKVFAEIEAYFGTGVTVKADNTVHHERYDFVII